MKRSPLYVLAAAMVAVFALVLLPTQQPASADSHGGSDADSGEAIHEAMVALGRSYKKVNSNLKDPEKTAASAEILAEMIATTVQAKAHLPKTATTDDLKVSYRVIMNKLIVVLANAENAALAGDNEKLAEYVKEAKGVKGEGHVLFITEDE
jgi:ABC-type cobalt transport system substrate-binding protein